MIFTTYGGTVTSADIEKEHRDARQSLIKKYEDQGYFTPYATIKADYEINSKHQASIKELTPLAHLTPLD